MTGGILQTDYNLRDGQLRGRYFTSSTTAYRGGLNIASNKDSQNKDNSTGETAIELAFGFEKHFDGTKRLSPYYGAEAYVGYSKQSKTVKGKDVDSDGKTRFGVMGVFGADYYFVKNVFLGVEAGWGIGFATQGDTSNLNIGN